VGADYRDLISRVKPYFQFFCAAYAVTRLPLFTIRSKRSGRPVVFRNYSQSFASYCFCANFTLAKK
jgi:hypothetical protein